MFELFPVTEERPKPWSVTRLNREVRACLEGTIGNVRIEGEISNLRRQPSGHQYFTLKDETCQVSCVLFRGAGASAPALRDGMQVELSGQISVYEARGHYQVIVRRVQPRGAGELEARLRALQEKLRAEGLFDTVRKRPLPPHPSRVGVVTSPSGAAIRDFLQILKRRAPHLEVFIAPVRVQGSGAALEIAAAVDAFSDSAGSGFPAVDVVVMTRGGGSLEDLWEFNEEIVARAIAACLVPVISAVGHEIDHTTSDLAADVRAPTPSAAAEILSADRAETLDRLAAAARRMTRETQSALELARAHLARRAASGVFVLPARRIADLGQLADDLRERAVTAVASRIERLRQSALRAASILQAREPSARLAAWSDRLDGLQRRKTRAIGAALDAKKQKRGRAAHALELLGPRQTLSRGFTMTLDGRRHPLASSDQARREKMLITVFADGETVSRPEN
ncbi:MAG: exodeoxyribonuclease VII large subunit [Chthoniobacterales bacterium]|nr:exodeoxyribonuclease VII large subunit [Chthoniobacterales bacterium]